MTRLSRMFPSISGHGHKVANAGEFQVGADVVPTQRPNQAESIVALVLT